MINGKYVQNSVFTKHSHFVNCLAYIQPSTTCVDGLVVSGGADKLIYVFQPFKTDEYVWELKGHTDNVCALAASSTGEIISGSWDKTARVWKDGKCIHILKGHTFAVWGVLPINDMFLTGILI